MTLLKINRLVITKNGKYVYDEKFHSGVNIIRGDNGSGKSTISNFIYYALGGDFWSWLPEAKSCDFVYAEVQVNNAIITIKREIEDRSMTNMEIFYGEFNNAIKQTINGWNRYSYKRSDTKDSFSQILFKLLDFPEISTDNGENITINQVLRLMYIDQLTPINSLVKTVDFDSPLIRKAVAYLLLGAYDDILLTNEQKLKNNKKLLAELEKEYKIYSSILKSTGSKLDTNSADKVILELEEQLTKINQSINNHENLKKSSRTDTVNKIILDKKNEIFNIREQAIIENDKINQLQVNILDSNDFIEDLKKQLQALKTSLISRNILGELPLEFCPSCLNELTENVDEQKCGLCKQVITVDKNLRVINMQQELSNQIKESEFLLERKKANIEKSAIRLDSLKATLKVKQKEFDNYTNTVFSTYDKKIEELLVKKGMLLNNIENKIKEKESISKLLNLQNRIDKIEIENRELQRDIDDALETLKEKASKAFKKIQEYTLILLNEDGKYATEYDSIANSSSNKQNGFYEEAFVNASNVYIDFANNSFSLDDRSNFSASSLVILKNSIRFGIFFASIELDYFRYPKFILCDNIEDKGMNSKRSKNFQKSIVQLANKFQDKEFQIIFTTSMMNEELEKDSYTIGPFYTSESKSLNFSN